MTRIGGLLRQHGAHLHRRGVGAQQHARAVFLRIEEEGVVHFPRRMAFGKIQLGEIVVVGLDVRTFGDRETHVGEDRVDLFEHLAQRMNAACFGRRLAQRQRDVDRSRGQPRIERRRLQDVAARGQRLGDLVLGEIDRRTLRLALVRRHLAERRQQCGDRAFLAERADTHRFERGLVGGGGDLGRESGIRVERDRTWRRAPLGNGRSQSICGTVIIRVSG